MWTCTCNTQNNTSSPFCSKCKSVMPQSEKVRIYKEQLNEARKALGIDYLADIEKAAQKYLGDDTISVEKISSAIFQIIHIILRWFFRYKTKIIAAILIIAFMSSAKDLSSVKNKQIHEQARAINRINRSRITYQVNSKIKTIPDRVKFYFDNPANSINKENIQKLDEKMDIVKDNLNKLKQLAKDNINKATQTATEFIEKNIKEISK